jgi:predicted nucleic acid-binding protein
MNFVPSSGWLKYSADGPNAKVFARPLQDSESLVVPTACLYEVFKIVWRRRGAAPLQQTVVLMRQGTIVELSERIATLAAELSLEHRLLMADGVILATARIRRADIWKRDADFKELENVTIVEKTRSSKHG